MRLTFEAGFGEVAENIEWSPNTLVSAKYSTYLKRSHLPLAFYREQVIAILLFMESNGRKNPFQVGFWEICIGPLREKNYHILGV